MMHPRALILHPFFHEVCMFLLPYMDLSVGSWCKFDSTSLKSTQGIRYVQAPGKQRFRTQWSLPLCVFTCEHYIVHTLWRLASPLWCILLLFFLLPIFPPLKLHKTLLENFAAHSALLVFVCLECEYNFEIVMWYSRLLYCWCDTLLTILNLPKQWCCIYLKLFDYLYAYYMNFKFEISLTKHQIWLILCPFSHHC